MISRWGTIHKQKAYIWPTRLLSKSEFQELFHYQEPPICLSFTLSFVHAFLSSRFRLNDWHASRMWFQVKNREGFICGQWLIPKECTIRRVLSPHKRSPKLNCGVQIFGPNTGLWVYFDCSLFHSCNPAPLILGHKFRWPRLSKRDTRLSHWN